MKRNFYLSLIGISLLYFSQSGVTAAVLADYRFSGGSLASSDASAETTASDFGNGAFTNTNGSVTLGFGFSNNNRSTDVPNVNRYVYSQADALTFGYFFEFDIAVDSGFQMDIDSLSAAFSRSGSGFESWAVDISTDGVSYTNLATSINNFDLDLVSTGNGDVTNLPNAGDFQGLTDDFQVRISIWRTNPGGNTGTRNFLDNIVVNGTVTVVPEPTTSVAILLGGGLSLWMRRRRRA